MIQSLRRFWASGVSIASVLAGFWLGALPPQPVQGAETIKFAVGGPLVVPISIDALETFAQTGEISGDLRLVARFVDGELLTLMRSGLNRPIPLSANTVAHLTYSPLGRDTLFNLGKLIRPHPEVHGATSLRAAMINAAVANPEGWTLIDVLRAFPTENIAVSLEDLLTIRRSLATFLSYNQAVVEAIQQQAAAEATAQPTIDLATLPDLTQPGPYAFQKETIVVENSVVRQTSTGLNVNYDFPVDVYLPQGTPGPAPIVILSHGFGDIKESFTFIAEHLASYGFVVLLPDHVGSDLAYRQQFLQGRLNTLLSPMEFLNRPQEISFLIDQLERLVAMSPSWADRLDLDRIGIMGDSLGATTALSLAGAEITYARIAEACGPDSFSLNFALYLECRARFLPPQNYQLRDDRIKAIYVTHPMGGHLFGPEGMSQIAIPLMMVVGSNDIVSTMVTEQAHPFIWSQANPKYLALLQVGTHFSSKPGHETSSDTSGTSGGGNEAVNQVFSLLTGQHRDVGTRYSKALSVAFWQTYLQDQASALPYLTARYGQAVSVDQPLRLDIIQALTPEQLVTAYGRTPPVPILPPSVAVPPPPRNETVLGEIERTGVLRVAFRNDAPPFGYIDSQNAWAGACGTMAIALSRHLTTALDTPVDIQVAELTSTLQNRFDLVRDGVVHLECGPNTIRTDVPGVAFSHPFYVTGAKFLVPSDRAATNFSQPGLRLGVLQDSTTEAFVRSTYPNATVVTFSGAKDREQAVQAVVAGAIDAFVSDSVLSAAERDRQNLSPSQFALVPEVPLTCEYYGLILPLNDPEWQTTVNSLLRESEGIAAAFEQNLSEFNYCLNR
ncbi:dienelactone hydrolase [filamentous cyanobacterium CCT1]|nr:dienelactone hydrolase [filamentous cyanobacterium CCT1]PSN80679.1 dienelactone hydrolase [filamentous cyanobacterium CCP4]